MPGPAIAGIAGALGSGLLQKKAADKAAGAQGRAADAQIAETRRQFDLIQGLLKPYVNAGTAGLQAQLDLMGLGGSGGIAPTIEQVGGTERRGAPATFKVGDKTFATKAEAETYANANKSPLVTAQEAQKAAIDGLAGGEQFGALVQQGEYGLLANQAATGGLRGGDTQAALAQFRPQMLQSLIDRQLANYGGIAANGQNAAAMTGTAAQNAGAQVNAALGDRGAAQAGAALAGGQAWANAGAGVLNTLGQASQQPGGMWAKWSF